MEKTMKRLMTLLLALVITGFCSTVLIAKGIKTKGIKVGLNLSDMTLGPSIGGYATFTINNTLSFQPEVIFSNRDSQQKLDIFASRLKLTSSINYFTVNPLALYSVNDRAYILAGPSIGSITRYNNDSGFDKDGEFEEDLEEGFEGEIEGEFEHEFEGEFEHELEEEHEDVESDEINGVGYGLAFGVGTAVSAINIEARYLLGLNKVYIKNFISRNFYSKNGVFQIMIGYSF